MTQLKPNNVIVEEFETRCIEFLRSGERHPEESALMEIVKKHNSTNEIGRFIAGMDNISCILATHPFLFTFDFERWRTQLEIAHARKSLAAIKDDTNNDDRIATPTLWTHRDRPTYSETPVEFKLLQIADGLFRSYPQGGPEVLIKAIETLKPLLEKPAAGVFQADALVTCSGAAALLKDADKEHSDTWRERARLWCKEAISHPYTQGYNAPRLRVNMLLLLSSQAIDNPNVISDCIALLGEIIELSKNSLFGEEDVEPLAKAITHGLTLLNAPTISNETASAISEMLWSSKERIIKSIDFLDPVTEANAVMSLASVGMLRGDFGESWNIISQRRREAATTADIRAKLNEMRCVTLLKNLSSDMPSDTAAISRRLRECTSMAQEAIGEASLPWLVEDAHRALYDSWKALIEICGDFEAFLHVREDVRFWRKRLASNLDPTSEMNKFNLKILRLIIPVHRLAVLSGEPCQDPEILRLFDEELKKYILLEEEPYLLASAFADRGYLHLSQWFPAQPHYRTNAAQIFLSRAHELLNATPSTEGQALERRIQHGYAALGALWPSAGLMRQFENLAYGIAVADEVQHSVSKDEIPALIQSLALLGHLEEQMGALLMIQQEKDRYFDLAAQHLHRAIELCKEIGDRESLRRICVFSPEILARQNASRDLNLREIYEDILRDPGHDKTVQLWAEIRLEAYAPSFSEARLVALSTKAFCLQVFDASYSLARSALEGELLPELRSNLEMLALRSLIRLAIGESKQGGGKFWSSKFVLFRDTVVDRLLLGGEHAQAFSLLHIWPPELERAALMFAHDRSRFGTMTFLEYYNDLIRTTEAALCAALVRRCRQFTTSVYRVAFTPRYFWITLDSATAPMARRFSHEAWGRPEVGFDGNEDLSASFRALDSYLVSLRVLANEKAGDEARRKAEALVAERQLLAWDALNRLCGVEQVGYLFGPEWLQLHSAIEREWQSCENSSIQVEIRRPLLRRATNSLIEAWRFDVGRVTELCRSTFGEWLGDSLGVISIVPSAGLNAYPLELALRGRSYIQWSVLGYPRDAVPWTSSSQALVVIGAVDQLRASGRESEFLREQFGPRGVSIGPNIRLGELRDAMANRSVTLVHFIGHSGFDLEGEKTGLRLNSVDVLTPLVISTMDLSHVALVALSSCESGMSKPSDFAGALASLAQAFLIAGVHHVIATRWPVEDTAAYEFTRHFYSFWCRGQHPAEAIANGLAEWISSNPESGIDAAVWHCWTT